ncbi:MAG: Rieske 2Fe-2S domain-containing protein [Acetobacteraceae bacterium]|nr:Rieske 2Fe-2S domain-containing protein [Acetobacteraceae bacterium]
MHGGHRPVLVIYDRGRVFALDNRCPHMGFPLERGRPSCPVEMRNGDVWVKTTFGHADPAAHCRQRLADGLAHDLGLVIAKAVHGQLAAGVPLADSSGAPGGALRQRQRARRLGDGAPRFHLRQRGSPDAQADRNRQCSSPEHARSAASGIMGQSDPRRSEAPRREHIGDAAIT